MRKIGALQVANMHANLVQDIVSSIQDVIQPALKNAAPPSLQRTDVSKESSLASTPQMNAMTIDHTLLAMHQ